MALCIAPFYVDNPAYPLRSNSRQIPAPCGKCPPCLARRTSAWSFRLVQHDKIASSSYFITLTYSNENVTMSKRGFMTLVKRDWQLFVKRLRKAQLLTNDNRKIRYYAVGEYGTSTWRPHFHAIIYDVNAELIERAWGLGIIDIQPVNGATVGYTCKYINKGKLIPVHANDDRQPEFSLMSKGLGKNYLTDDMIKYHRDDITRLYCTVEGGKKIAMPRYYKNKIYTETERQKQQQLYERSSIDLDNQKRADFLETYGTLETYDRFSYEAKKAAILNFKQLQQTKRKKI